MNDYLHPRDLGPAEPRYPVDVMSDNDSPETPQQRKARRKAVRQQTVARWQAAAIAILSAALAVGLLRRYGVL